MTDFDNTVNLDKGMVGSMSRNKPFSHSLINVENYFLNIYKVFSKYSVLLKY